MSFILVALLTWLGPSAQAASGHPGETTRVGDWRLTVHREVFTGVVTCKLVRGRTEYRRHTLIVHLPARVDTSAAVYRIDQGKPFWVRQDQMRTARMGFALDDDSLENPSGGLVRIPAERLVGAHALSIEATTNLTPFQFRIDGLDAALARAGRLGCDAGGLD